MASGGLRVQKRVEYAREVVDILEWEGLYIVEINLLRTLLAYLNTIPGSLVYD